jgi:hypothetical protein
MARDFAAKRIFWQSLSSTVLQGLTRSPVLRAALIAKEIRITRPLLRITRHLERSLLNISIASAEPFVMRFDVARTRFSPPRRVSVATAKGPSIPKDHPSGRTH